jgi:DNA-directed RNA polymerase subunit RPC12/RpoP
MDVDEKKKEASYCHTCGTKIPWWAKDTIPQRNGQCGTCWRESHPAAGGDDKGSIFPSGGADTQVDEQKYCRYCGAANPIRALFCAKCGEAFTSASTSPLPAPQPSVSQVTSGYQTLDTPPLKPQQASIKSAKHCKTCGRKISFLTSNSAASRGGQCNKCWKQELKRIEKRIATVVPATPNTKIVTKKIPKIKTITETRCTCNSCGKVWHYGKQEQLESAGAAMHNLGKSMTCCSGCAPAVLIPDKKVTDLNKCPECGSKNIRKEQIVHEVSK